MEITNLTFRFFLIMTQFFNILLSLQIHFADLGQSFIWVIFLYENTFN